VNLPELAARFAPMLAGIFGLCVVGGLVAIYLARRRARTTGFGFVRERALYAARRWMIGTSLLVLLSGASVGLWAMAVYRPEVLPTPMPTATLTLIPSPTPRPPTSTPTLTLVPTITPSATPASTQATPASAELPTAVGTPGTGSALIAVTLAAGEKENMPVGPTTVFVPGTKRVYAFMLFDGMSQGVEWTHVWYGEMDGQMTRIWGKTEQWSREYSHGQIWRYFDTGVGKFELRVYVGDELQRTVPFWVQGG
jgi:hypothetical protein